MPLNAEILQLILQAVLIDEAIESGKGDKIHANFWSAVAERSGDTALWDVRIDCDV